MLVSLSDMKTHLGVVGSTYDTFLTDQLNAVSAAIEGYCGRKFIQNQYTQTFYRDEYKLAPKRLILYHYPVVSIDDIEEDDVDLESTDYRISKNNGILVSENNGFMICSDKLEVTYTSGYLYADIPYVITYVVKAIVKEAYDKKVSGLDVSVGKEVSRMSLVGVISFDFDHTLSNSDRDIKFGKIIGSYVNMLDPYRTEHALGLNSGRIYIVET